jgi:hypothetical protein
LNRERSGAPYERYEILNFGVPGYQPPQQLIAIEKAMRFQPNAVFFVGTGREISRAVDYLVEVVRKGIAIPYPPLADIIRKAGVTAGENDTAGLRRLQPYRGDVLASTYGLISAQIRSGGAVPVFIFLPQVRGGNWEEETPETLRMAAAAGFIVIDLSDVYAGEPLEVIRLAEWDEHPNAKGHRLIADKLYAAIESRSDIILRPRDESAPR